MKMSMTFSGMRQTCDQVSVSLEKQQVEGMGMKDWSVVSLETYQSGVVTAARFC
jgi:hypothetical protein